ncbi:HD domain-containing phosphohydrolase [Acidovorax sp. Root267]|uniref:HD domain-containing phosphohydrolase n=1 Tax=Acidovorax sp. Root267 TaxID=1736505 RepID=UPI0009E95856|nr:HD domain-containing phosphohydrolase [Acidovorax sp. Root267]
MNSPIDVTALSGAALQEEGASLKQDDGQRVWRILCVDDEPNIVASLRRLFRGSGYQVATATSGAEAIAHLEQEPVDLVFSDMRMPGMSGAQLLEQIRERWPKTTRVLLTGYADIGSTIAAINSGEVYRYITKPWDDGEVLATAHQIFERHALEDEKARLEELLRSKNQALMELNETLEEKVAARTSELLQLSQKIKKNYLTSIKVFSNLMEWRGGQLSGHSRRVADLARRTARAMNMAEADQQDAFIAGLMHDIGQIALPDTLLAKPVPKLSEEETAQYRRHAVLGEQALMALDDMQTVSNIIRSHHERHDGLGYPDGLVGEMIPMGACILAVADTYDDLQIGHLSSTPLSAADARSMIARGRGTQFHPEVVDVFLQMLLKAAPGAEIPPRLLRTEQLRPGMVLARDLLSSEGAVLLAADHVLTAELIKRLRMREGRDDVEMILPIKP